MPETKCSESIRKTCPAKSAKQRKRVTDRQTDSHPDRQTDRSSAGPLKHTASEVLNFIMLDISLCTFHSCEKLPLYLKTKNERMAPAIL